MMSRKSVRAGMWQPETRGLREKRLCRYYGPAALRIIHGRSDSWTGSVLVAARRLLQTAILIVCFASIHVEAKEGAIALANFSKAPNYVYCTDSDDAHQLTDGELTHFPIWTQKGTVGWSGATPIALEFRIIGDGQTGQRMNGIVRLRTAKGLEAGVDIPRRLDIYSKDAQKQFRLIGTRTTESKEFSDRAAHWVDVQVDGAADALLVVVHASGVFVFLDEVVWMPSEPGMLPINAPSVSDMRSALDDSVERFKRDVTREAEKEINGDRAPIAKGTLQVWNQDPWGEFSGQRGSLVSSRDPKTISLAGHSLEHEIICFGIVAGEDVTKDGLRVTVDASVSRAVRMSEVKAVVAATGRMVFDPLVPLASDGTLQIQHDRPGYLWIEIDFEELGPGTHNFSLTMAGNNRQLIVPIEARVVPMDRKEVKRLDAVNWAYLSDKPIFTDITSAIDDLMDHGINVFVAHPATIPGVALNGAWTRDDAGNRYFNRTVELARRGGTLLLFLGWTATKNPVGYSPGDETLQPHEVDKLTTWIERMARYLMAKDIPPERWALYLVDEPDRDSLRFLKIVAETVKRKFPLIQFYANPVSGTSNQVKSGDVGDAMQFIELWQPSLEAVRGSLWPVFQSSHRRWWIYSNPTSPPKAADPLNTYRLTSWWAWYLGASGVGFWSYSDTGGTSAWDDFDGSRPDWAVVYEYRNGVISSRRWEAFRKGLEDYILLGYADSAVRDRIGAVLNQGESLTTGVLSEMRYRILESLFKR